MNTCQRKTYSRLYIVVRIVSGQPLTLLHSDGRIIAFSSWSEAVKRGAPLGGFVTNWEEFKKRFLERLIPRPPALRILSTDNKNVSHVFYGELDASAEELATLYRFTPYELEHEPTRVAIELRRAKVREELS